MCADGFFEQFAKCVACPPSGGASIGVLVGISATIVGLCIVVFLVRELLPVDVLKLGLSMLQVRRARVSLEKGHCTFASWVRVPLEKGHCIFASWVRMPLEKGHRTFAS